MGLQRDIERVIEETAGASIPGGFSKDQKSMVKKFSRGITNSIVRWLLDQEFTITEMKAVIGIERFSTTTSMPVNVKSNTLLGPYGPVFSGIGQIPGAGGVVTAMQNKVESVIEKVAGEGATLPALNFKSKPGGQGGFLRTYGHAYVGPNPYKGNETNEDKTKVKLLRKNLRNVR